MSVFNQKHLLHQFPWLSPKPLPKPVPKEGREAFAQNVEVGDDPIAALMSQIQVGKDVSDSQLKDLTALVTEVFSMDDDDIGFCNKAEH